MFDANCSEATVEADLEAGWNYVSTNVTPDSYGIASMFESPLEGNLLKVLGDQQFCTWTKLHPGHSERFQLASNAHGCGRLRHQSRKRGDLDQYRRPHWRSTTRHSI